MSADPNGTREVSVTIKFPQSESYQGNGSWLVFRGSTASVREDLIESFGLTETDDLTLSDLACNAQVQAYAQGTAANGLGGRTVSNRSSSSRSSSTAGSSSTSTTSESKDEASASDPLLDEIAGLTSLEDHKNTWADNKDALQARPEALEAWKVKGRELKGA